MSLCVAGRARSHIGCPLALTNAAKRLMSEVSTRISDRGVSLGLCNDLFNGTCNYWRRIQGQMTDPREEHADFSCGGFCFPPCPTLGLVFMLYFPPCAPNATTRRAKMFGTRLFVLRRGRHVGRVPGVCIVLSDLELRRPPVQYSDGRQLLRRHRRNLVHHSGYVFDINPPPLYRS